MDLNDYVVEKKKDEDTFPSATAARRGCALLSFGLFLSLLGKPFLPCSIFLAFAFFMISHVLNPLLSLLIHPLLSASLTLVVSGSGKYLSPTAGIYHGGKGLLGGLGLIEEQCNFQRDSYFDVIYSLYCSSVWLNRTLLLLLRI